MSIDDRCVEWGRYRFSCSHIKTLGMFIIATSADEMIDRVPLQVGVIQACSIRRETERQTWELWGRKRVFDNDSCDICKTVSDVQIKSNLSKCKYVIHGPLSGKQHVNSLVCVTWSPLPHRHTKNKFKYCSKCKEG